MRVAKKKISIVIPCYNEGKNVNDIYDAVTKILSPLKNFDNEIIFVNDGSQDDTATRVQKIAKNNKGVLFVNLSRNFGKEVALTAGINESGGDAVICLDADGQHPVELIPQFVKKWEKGFDVVVGVRAANKGEGLIKKFGSKLFYKLFNGFSGTALVPGATDFSLLDRQVVNELNALEEDGRILRGLVDWLGFPRTYINFHAKERQHGQPSYSIAKLFGLAVNSFISLSLKPLMLAGYLGIFITLLAFITGMFILIQDVILNDPLNLKITGTAMLAVFITFLIGIILMAQGLIAIYISRIYTSTRNRPLYIIDRKRSVL